MGQFNLSIIWLALLFYLYGADVEHIYGSVLHLSQLCWHNNLFDQKCRPQYRFFSSWWWSNIFMALFPFKKPTASDTEYFGGISNTKWIWSIWMLPSRISIFFHSHSCRMISRSDLPIAPFSIRNRYFGHHTIWYLHRHTACANLLNCFIEYLLWTYRVTTTPFLRRYSFFVNPYCNRIAKLGLFSPAEGLRS